MTFDETGNPILEQFSEEGFVDCVFRIARAQSDEFRYRLRLSASYRGVVVGFSAIVRRGIGPGFDRDMQLIPEHVYRPAVWFERSGPERDALITVLAEQYGLPGGPLRMVETLSFTGIALHNEDIDMETTPIHIKLFGRDSDADIERGDYFESYFNLDLSSGFVSWNEKDLDYRTPLIRGLSHPPSQDGV